MTDRPILFSGPMVRALLAGTKAQTRRIIKPRGKRPGIFDGSWTDSYVLDPGNESWRQQDIPIKVGDRLWVKETVRAYERPEDCVDGVIHLADEAFRPIECTTEAAGRWVELNHIYGKRGAVCPSIFMPRWASRITLKVLAVRVERLRDISREDAIAEGLEWVMPTFGVSGIASTWNADPRESYLALWDHINGAGAAAKNPWVIAYTFLVIKQNIDRIAA